MTETVSVTEYDVAEAIVRKQLEIKRLTEEVDSLKDYFREGRTHDLEKDGRPTFLVRVTANTRLDDKLAQAHLSPSEYIDVSKRVLDTAAARATLTANDLAAITKTYGNKVEVTLA